MRREHDGQVGVAGAVPGGVNVKAGPGLREIGPTFGPLVTAWRTTAAGYSDEELRLLLLEFQRKLEDIVRGQLARLRDDLDRHAPSRG